MKVEEVMATLAAMGTAQNRKIYANHGASEPMFGVSFANLKVLKKKIKQDHDLGVQLWESGNVDAMSLATMILDPSRLDEETAMRWLQGLNYYLLVDLLVGSVISRTSYAMAKMKEWTQAEDEYIGAAGWHLLSYFAQNDASIPDAFFEPYIERIEAGIHAAKNRTRHSMNGALLGIGLRSDGMEIKATAAALRIGKVVVDHGKTGCKTPDAVPYIKKARAHRRKHVGNGRNRSLRKKS